MLPATRNLELIKGASWFIEWHKQATKEKQLPNIRRYDCRNASPTQTHSSLPPSLQFSNSVTSVQRERSFGEVAPRRKSFEGF